MKNILKINKFFRTDGKESMLEVLINPNNFFKNRMDKEMNFQPLLIILAITCIGILNITFLFSNISSDYLGVSEYALARFRRTTMTWTLFGSFIYWVILSGIFYLISTVFNGKGHFDKVVEFVGYGFIPTLIDSIFTFIVNLIVFSQIDFASIQDIYSFEEVISSYPIFKGVEILAILLGLWSAYIWIYGISHSRNLSVKDATVVVGVPIGISILSAIYKLF